MIVEILGVDPRNKGARLMLEAVCAQVRSAFPNARLAVPGPWPADARAALDLWMTMPHHGGAGGKLTLLSQAPAAMRHLTQVIPHREVNVVLHASGFAYGDFWGVEKLERRLTSLVRTWKNDRNTLVLLPQAWGPFDKEGMRTALAEALAGANLAYARDKVSLNYLEAAAPSATNIRFAPDFTNLLHPPLPRRLSHLAGKAVVIPNEKLVSKAPPERREIYLRFLAQAVAALAETGREVLIVVHEGARDRALAEALNAELPRPIEIIDEPSALHTKALIAASDIVVSSRFHGLVSALAGGVPALACGWSHKYRELMSDYDSAAHVVELDAIDTWNDRLETLIADAASTAFREKLAQAGARERARSTAMWAEVLGLLKDRGYE